MATNTTQAGIDIPVNLSRVHADLNYLIGALQAMQRQTHNTPTTSSPYANPLPRPAMRQGVVIK